MGMRQPRWESEKYRRWVASRPCSCCGRSGPSQAAHYQGIRQHTFGAGRGVKGDDMLLCALCPECHRKADAYELSVLEGRDMRRIDSSELWLYWIAETLRQAVREGVLELA